MGSALASLLGLVFTGIALYGFYWVIRLAVRDGMLEADRRRSRALPSQPPQSSQPVQAAQPAKPTQPTVGADSSD
jgi:hypothetical protein